MEVSQTCPPEWALEAVPELPACTDSHVTLGVPGRYLRVHWGDVELRLSRCLPFRTQILPVDKLVTTVHATASGQPRLGLGQCH